jgi:hypothetical protein
VEVQSGFLGYTRSGLHWTADAIGKLPALAFLDDCRDCLVMSLIHRAARNQQTPMYVFGSLEDGRSHQVDTVYDRAFP